MTEIVNFGNNVRFTPRETLAPRNDNQLLAILNDNTRGRIRVAGSRHSWSDAIVSEDVLVDMRHFDSIEIIDHDGEHSVRVGAGCQIKKLLSKLAGHGLTLPSVGLIAEQTIAGAIATGTHGSGRHSLSHYPKSIRLACYRSDKGVATIVDVDEGDELRAARCSLGTMGIVVSVELPCVPQYQVLERARFCGSIEEALASENDAPLQQFFLFPHQWGYSVQERTVVQRSRSWSAPLYRIYWLSIIDISLHLLVKLFAAVLKSRMMTQVFYKYLLKLFVFPWWHVVDRSDRMLVMNHHLFRHLELEAFVRQEHIESAARFVEIVLKQADGQKVELSSDIERKLNEAKLLEEFASLRGVFAHHYPVCFRRVLPDDTLISMSSGDNQCWYAISFITYVEPREDFFRMARFLAKSILELFDGRIHWGKWFPLETPDIERMYPDIEKFRVIVRDFDPQGVFQNRFTEKIMAQDKG